MSFYIINLNIQGCGKPNNGASASPYPPQEPVDYNQHNTSCGSPHGNDNAPESPSPQQEAGSSTVVRPTTRPSPLLVSGYPAASMSPHAHSQYQHGGAHHAGRQHWSPITPPGYPV